MKKLLCVAIMLCMMMTIALAQEAPSMTWESIAPVMEASNITGEFHTFDKIAVKIWLPEGLKPIELTEEDTAKGYIGSFMPEDESAKVVVMYVDLKGMTLEDYAKHLANESDVTDIGMATVNGLPCVTYKMPEQDSVSATFTTQAGYVLEVTCAPASQENAELVWSAVIASIQATE